MIDVEFASPFYPDLDGLPLQLGSIYYGVAGQNPVTSPITVYWDAAGTQPAAQPIAVVGGRPVRNGTPARVYITGDYSKLVRDAKGRQVSYEPSQSSRNLNTLPFLQTGTQAAARGAEEKMRDIISSRDNGPLGGGIVNDGAKLRALLADAAVGSTVLIKAGTYLLDQDGVHPYCLGINKPLHLIFEPGTVFKATTAGVRSVVQISAPITHSGAPVIDGDNKTNQAVEIVVGAYGTTLRKWEGKNVTQQYSAVAASAAVFVVVSEVGIVFDGCYAHDAISYPNAVQGDVPGTARGFQFYGNAPQLGSNGVINCRVDRIMNTNGLAGAYEDEDGIVSQMPGSVCFVDGNTITQCMKRGVKMQNPGVVRSNQIVSSRTGPDNSLETTTRMYSGISVYSDDVIVSDNRIGSGTCFGLGYGGSFNFGVEIGVSGGSYSRIAASENNIRIGTGSNARGVELMRVFGAPLGLTVAHNHMEVDAGPTITNVFGIRTDFDHATLLASVDISDNTTKNTTYSMQLRGGFCGQVNENKCYANSGGVGMIVVDPSGSALRPTSVSFSGNEGFGANDYTVRINDTGATGIAVHGTKSESTTTAAVFITPSIRSYEWGSSGGLLRPARVYSNVVPATGTWARGDSVMNRDPSPIDPVVEWRCVVAGTPGTWRPVSWITTKDVSGNRPLTLTANDYGVMYIDTTLVPVTGKPIWWNGAAWVDATGAVV